MIDRWRTPEAIKIARSDDDRMTRIREITDELNSLLSERPYLVAGFGLRQAGYRAESGNAQNNA